MKYIFCFTVLFTYLLLYRKDIDQFAVSISCTNVVNLLIQVFN